MILVVLPVFFQLRRGFIDETRLMKIPLDRTPNFPTAKQRRALIVQQWRILNHYVQQMQTLILGELILPSVILGRMIRQHLRLLDCYVIISTDQVILLEHLSRLSSEKSRDDATSTFVSTKYAVRVT